MTTGIQGEITAYVFYKRGAEKIENPKIRQALIKLAEEEKGHFLTLEKYHDYFVRSEKWVTYRDVMLQEGLPEINEELDEKHRQLLGELESATTTLDILMLALTLEKNAFDLFQRAQETAVGDDEKEMFSFLKKFEREHIALISQLITEAYNNIPPSPSG